MRLRHLAIGLLAASLFPSLASAQDAGHALDWAPEGRDGTGGSGVREEALRRQLPDALAELGVEDARLGLHMGLLVVYSRLGFENRISDILGQNEDMLELGSCTELMDRARLPAEERPWITYLVYRHLESSDPPAAYRFAARTLFPGDASGIDADLRASIEEWITGGSEYSFSCPSCGSPANPTVQYCIQDNRTDLVDFVASRTE